MGMTMSQKILADKAGLPQVSAGELIYAEVDMVLGNDITTPVAIREYQEHGCTEVFHKDKISIVLDHFTPSKDIKAAELCATCRDFANANDIKHFYDVGAMGIEHALLPEQGIVAAGELIVGADSHTCTYGALGAFSTGFGSTDMAAAMATGKCWFKVPAAIRFELTGKPREWVSGKDIILYIIGKIGVDGALYKSMEFVGDGIQYLSMDDRFTIANMAIEAGAKNGIFPVDDATRTYMKGRVDRAYKEYTADPDAVYDETYVIDLSALEPIVAFPHLPENARPAKEATGIKIDQVIIGSCTNGRFSDLAVAAAVFKNNHVAKNVRTVIIPATQQIYLDAMKAGYIEIFIKAGCAVSTPTCGPCLGGHMGIMAAGERTVATTNRNFVGRMGHVTSEVYLASPAVAAASAVCGSICTPDML
ncbi:3-isopropylmalate dehydratase large subunit [Hydrogenoanaerobacterium sp.]|uniref:3-isopropylmalate dehydratase large subunit n=1 Tax=Hydrogenoanaerobacterium sp. TaxID=2953763 RepID=UPI00289CFBA8|nr:3-isopropylmalate dehydratase large subunit [Hydrogenoanaerobacterium sp.]